MSVKSYLSSNNTLPSARQISSNEVNLILKSLNSKKTSGTDKIPTKLVKLASIFLSTLLAIALIAFNSLASFKFHLQPASLFPTRIYSWANSI